MEFLLSPEEAYVVNEFEKYRNQVNKLIQDNIKKGLYHLKSHDFDQAGTIVIGSEANEDVALTHLELGLIDSLAWLSMYID
jgi:hypothetical protein